MKRIHAVALFVVLGLTACSSMEPPASQASSGNSAGSAMRTSAQDPCMVGNERGCFGSFNP